MIAEIVAIGTELLMGQIADSDAQMLSRELQSLGIAVYHHQVVGDNPQRMREALALALSRSDLVITTGGLGPTQDDLSKEIAAELLGLPMEFDPESWDAIGRYFEKIGRVCPMNNRKQAMFAKGCTILPNACGTAPGCMIEKDGKIVVQLPGPPHEMADMFGRQVYGRLAKKTGGCIASRFIRIYGMGESQVAQTCARWIENGEGVTVAPYCALGECQLRVTARGRDEDEALRQVEPVVDAICGVLGDCVYDVTETSEGSMQEAAGRALKFYASELIDIRRGEQLKDGTTVVGNRTKAKIVKNKVAPPFRTAEFDILYGEGISKEGSLLDSAVALDIIHKSGAWFSYGDQRIGQGRENTRKFLKENAEIAAEIDKLVRAELMGKDAPVVQSAADDDERPTDDGMDDLPNLDDEE